MIGEMTKQDEPNKHLINRSISNKSISTVKNGPSLSFQSKFLDSLQRNCDSHYNEQKDKETKNYFVQPKDHFLKPDEHGESDEDSVDENTLTIVEPEYVSSSGEEHPNASEAKNNCRNIKNTHSESLYSAPSMCYNKLKVKSDIPHCKIKSSPQNKFDNLSLFKFKRSACKSVPSSPERSLNVSSKGHSLQSQSSEDDRHSKCKRNVSTSLSSSATLSYFTNKSSISKPTNCQTIPSSHLNDRPNVCEEILKKVKASFESLWQIDLNCKRSVEKNSFSREKQNKKTVMNNSTFSTTLKKSVNCSNDQIGGQYTRQERVQAIYNVTEKCHKNFDEAYGAKKICEVSKEDGQVTISTYPESCCPSDDSDFSSGQLDSIFLPPFKTIVITSSKNIDFRSPGESYICTPCGDRFFVKNSLKMHKERRTMLISLNCHFCSKMLTFYNKCTYRDHVEHHRAKGEAVDDASASVQLLPLHETRLLEPLFVPKSKGQKQLTAEDRTIVSTNTKDLVCDRLAESNTKSSTNTAIGVDSHSNQLNNVRCYICNNQFKDVKKLISHMGTDQPSSDESIECTTCQLMLPSACAAKAHFQTHPPANVTENSVCPECGSLCTGPRDFVRHLNTCGHQYRRSGILCTLCNACFFKHPDDFVHHLVSDHCNKFFVCPNCPKIYDSFVNHTCGTCDQPAFNVVLTCPLCCFKLIFPAKNYSVVCNKVKEHLVSHHKSFCRRVYYVYKSKFCINAFKSKEELHVHHDLEHLAEKKYIVRPCSLEKEVLVKQKTYFHGTEQRNAFITIELEMNSSKYNDTQQSNVSTDTKREDELLSSMSTDRQSQFMEENIVSRENSFIQDTETCSSSEEIRVESNTPSNECIAPCICYLCGHYYDGVDDLDLHASSCQGPSTERLCQVCGVAAQGKEFADHCVSSHIKDGMIICIYCSGTSFSSLHLLHQHFELHVHEQFTYPFICPFCQVTLPNPEVALHHLHLKHRRLASSPQYGQLDVECKKCGRKFHGEHGLTVHSANCSGASAVSLVSPKALGSHCRTCQKYITPDAYGKHIINHLEDGLLLCGVCHGLSFDSSMELLYHLEEHVCSLSYPFNCPMCGYKMINSNEGLSHLKEEHGFGEMHCSECDMRFTFSYQLEKHISIVHKICLYSKRRYICWICQAFDHVKKEAVINHFITIHGINKDDIVERTMIRTRGLGSKPTAEFFPLKSVKCRVMTKKFKSASSFIENSSKTSDSDRDGKHDKRHNNSTSLKMKMLYQAAKNNYSIATPTSPARDSSSDINTDNFNIKEEFLEVNDGKTIVEEKETNCSQSFNDKLDNCSSNNDAICESDSSKVSTIETSETLNESFVSNNPSETSTVSCSDSSSHKCKYCSHIATSKQELRGHVKNKHKKRNSDGTYACPHCGQMFVVEPSLRRHLLFAHKIKEEMTIKDDVSSGNEDSPEAYGSEDSLTTISQHPLANGEQQESAVKRKLSDSHLSIEDRENKRRKSKRCKKPPYYSSDPHFTSEHCNICKESFFTSSELYRHLKTHGMAFLTVGRRIRSSISQ